MMGVNMKRFSFIVLSVFLISGCEKRSEPVKTMFSGNINPHAVSVQSVSIQPENPTVNTTLTVSVPQHLNTGSVTWYINNQRSMVANSLHGDFKKGDSITAVVNYADRNGKQEAVTSPNITIQDTPPVISSIILTPLYPTIASTIHAEVQASDADGDQVSLEYQWYVNGNPVQDQTGDSFSCSSYKHGDTIYVLVTPPDDEKKGVSTASASLSLQDTAPVILSKPPDAITGSIYSYKVEASDIDNDPLSYKLESAPPGMTISKEGVISWDTAGIALPLTATAKVVIDDGFGGKAYQSFRLQIEKGK
jgi:hypothetical protein